MMTSPKYILLFVFLVFSFFLSFSYVQSQSPDSCNSLLNLPNPPPFDIASLNCAPVWSDQSFFLRYGQSSPNIWNFILSAPDTNAYIAMGFSPNGNMEGSRAVVGWVGAGGMAEVRKYFLAGKSPDLVRLEPSDQELLQVVNSSVTVGSNHIYMTFQLMTDKPSTRLIYALGPQGRLPTSPNFELSRHRDMTSTVLNYATGQFQTERSTQTSLQRTHGLLNMFAWAILMPIGVMVARYMRKWDPIWFYSHAVIQSFAFILGFIGIICGLVLENRIDASVTSHKGIGIFILILGCLQVTAFVVRPDKTSKSRKYWNWYHFSVGRILIFLAAVNVFYGIHLSNAGSGWNAGFAMFLVIVFVICLILELRVCLRK